MDNNPSTSSGQEGKFFNGFLLGFLVGALVVFLLGTKKGKRIWKAISEEGIDNISNILEDANKTEGYDEVSTDAKAMVDKSEGQRKEFVQKREFAIKEKSIEEKPRVRRFFRGISRRVN